MSDALPDDWRRWRRAVDLDEYEARWARIEAEGGNPHGEADLVVALLAGRTGAPVLDGGCGTGRVAVELARRGVDVEGLDPDGDMIALARGKAPELTWRQEGLQDLADESRFGLVLLAGNVVPYADPADRPGAVAACARALRTGGLLVAGFTLRPGWPSVADYDGWCAAAGLVLDARWSTWTRDPYAGGDYAVSVHRRP
ncbi:Methyltransferase type 11 [Pseudonocardia dioxanivorans CB1190]|uniref:Methyltransferase type 11 n=1 Tax=Pseudonocardia dioxanivorans (strain ATCC 55486 / DSM 44775 / JCM 13855 / CB1190) TaxID=675635 RepID=F4CSZ8_PSEUX|nr:class I SAM-dependent methyltransferase [Pseudonocardia dioxanivorans]AEA25297.1 Methyltransferase type 11 [Pseudonocardia dioxanivorans CB1190]GJF03731.1 hypothetical protein PSD17_26910 [Pseudonocardia sp. D17]